MGGWVKYSVAVSDTAQARLDQYLAEHQLASSVTKVLPLTGDASDRRYYRALLKGGDSLVLALHGTACVAGFIAGASMPIAAAQRTGFSRWVHVKAGELPPRHFTP